MKISTKLLYASFILTSLCFISVIAQNFTVTPDLTSDRKEFSNEIAVQSSQPYENNVADAWARQDSANCGPTSLYMIFKYYNDHKKENIFYDDGTALSGSKDIRIDVTYLSATSNINLWLGYVTYFFGYRVATIGAGGISKSVIVDKLSTLKYDGEYYYDVIYNSDATSTESTKINRLNSIYNEFLSDGCPVMIHLARDGSGHYIVMVGLDKKNTATTADDEVIFMDPNIDKYEHENVPITNNIPNNPLLTVSYSDFINEEWYDNGNGDLAWWDGVWFGFGSETESEPEPEPEPDTIPPSQVTGLSAVVVSENAISLSWNANSESDLDHYNIYRNGAKVDETTSTSYTSTGLTPDTTYTYQVSAVDTSDNEGASSSAVPATTDELETPTMHVASIAMSYTNRWSYFYIYVVGYNIYSEIRIQDNSGNNLASASVSMELTLPDGTKQTASGTTDSSGLVSIKIKVDKISGTYTSTITSVYKSGYTYLPSSNIETSENLII